MNVSLRNLLVIFLYCVFLVPAAKVPIETSENLSILNISSNSVTNLTSPLPPAPLGFGTELYWNESVPLLPLGVWVTAIKLMYGLSQQFWSHSVELVHSGLALVVGSLAYHVAIHTNGRPPSIELTAEFVVRALHQVVTAMANYAPGFCGVKSFIQFQGRTIGRIWITTLDDPAQADLSAMNSTSTSNVLGPLDLASGNNETESSKDSNLTSNHSGEIPDPDDAHFMLSYRYTGQGVSSREIFSAIFDGLTTVSQYNDDGPVPFIVGFSTSGNTGIDIQVLPGQVMYGWHVSRAFYLLVNMLYLVQGYFQEIEFVLFYYGTEVATGLVATRREVGGDGGTGVTASG